MMWDRVPDRANRRPIVGETVRNLHQKELVGEVVGLKMNCIIVLFPQTKKHPNGRRHYWADGSFEIIEKDEPYDPNWGKDDVEADAGEVSESEADRAVHQRP